MDVDGVVADLHTPWINIYNNMFVDNLRVKDITDFKISNFVKNEAKEEIYKIANDKSIYYFVKPIFGSKRGIKALRKAGHRVVFLTACSENMKGVKFNWLNANGFKVDEKDYIESQDKSVFEADIMIDDRYKNVIDAKVDKAYLYTRPWNEKYDYFPRVKNWKDIERELVWNTH